MKAARFTEKGSKNQAYLFINLCIQYSGGKLEIANVPIPTPGAGEVRIKVHACGVCHSDLFTRAAGLGNPFPRVP